MKIDWLLPIGAIIIVVILGWQILGTMKEEIDLYEQEYGEPPELVNLNDVRLYPVYAVVAIMLMIYAIWNFGPHGPGR